MPANTAAWESDPYRKEQPISDAVENMKDLAERARGKASELGEAAVRKVDEKRGPAAEALESAASTLHQKADKVTTLAHGAADRMENAAAYVRDHNARDMASDLEQFVRSHPGQSLAVAAVFGFLLGRVLRSD